MKNILFFVWEFLQNFVGLLVIGWNKLINNGVKKNTFDNVTFYTMKHFFNSGVSLGQFIILDDIYNQEKYKIGKNSLLKLTVHHEDGHRKQSRMLGPLYLFVIGIPSALHNLYNRTLKEKMTEAERIEEYYNWYCEKWADQLSGIVENRKEYINERK